MEKRVLGTISILTSNRQGNSLAMNQLLTTYGHHIIARLGVNVNRQCVEACPGLITLTLDTTQEIITELTAKLNAIADIKASMVIMMTE
ncbi:hypothetical protein COT98_02965 [Candidatus Falkowbacteria bacterium CG10_big_fil_rev_8_21_14_0_10_39_9]|uniref:CopG family transcriptional regulator n=1 Tax=Candidatus Falkowbacteria bacterium CG10_big_fil_rev_8_21_14_0_10_39_9 TaxID=1974566 RepID=A0A2M6WP59_9BACT|nr:MAG: hypothetical protein COT98_02965 [Candidatus Falkowbacteria bacterium CG10_big_fil_rev_8_21_14_0_10_39_9]